MTKKTKLILQEKIYEGYLQFYKCNVEVPSLNPEKGTINLKNREVLHSADSILVLIYVPLMDSFVLCQEFRIGVFCNENQDEPFILNCVSGTIEPDDTPEETAIREVYEETGLRVNDLQPIAQVYKSPGLMTEKTYLYYGNINELPKTGFYSLADEEIRVQLIPRASLYKLMDEMKIIDSATFIALNWFRAKENAPLR